MTDKITRKRLIDTALSSTVLAEQGEFIIRTLLKERQDMAIAVDKIIDWSSRFYDEPDGPGPEEFIEEIYKLRADRLTE